MVTKNMFRSRSKQMPLTGQITPHVRTYFWITIWYKYHDLLVLSPPKYIVFSFFSKICVIMKSFEQINIWHLVSQVF